jgi:hypothetical protein
LYIQYMYHTIPASATMLCTCKVKVTLEIMWHFFIDSCQNRICKHVKDDNLLQLSETGNEITCIILMIKYVLNGSHFNIHFVQVLLQGSELNKLVARISQRGVGVIDWWCQMVSETGNEITCIILMIKYDGSCKPTPPWKPRR